MTLDEIAAKLDKAKLTSYQGLPLYESRCPAHDDKSPSFSIWEGADGWLHGRCKAGCTEDAWMSALGITHNDRRLKAPLYTNGKPVTVDYEYTDERGRYLFTKRRKVPKQFVQLIKENGQETWSLKSLGSQCQALYRLPEVIAAVEQGQTVYVCEGEKGVEAVRKAGAVATCQPGGAGENNWRPVHSTWLEGANVVIVADRDKAGEEYAAKVFESLLPRAKTVKVVQSKTTGDKDDAWDHLEAGHSLTDFVPYNSFKPTQKWISAADIKPTVVDWLWELYIPIGEVTMIVGNPGDGKSTVAQAIVSAVTRGATLFGDTIPKGKAVFLSAEQSVSSVTVPRFIQMEADLSGIILPDEVSEDDEPVPFTLDKAGMNELREVCLEVRPKIVVIDTVTAYIEASRDFNSANQTREWMRRLAEIARITPCAVVLLGHLNKNSMAHPLMRILGSIDFVGASRSVLLVGKDPDEETRRGMCQIKSNVGPFGDPRGFSLEGGVFGWTDGEGLDATRMLQPAAVQMAQTTRDRCAQWIASLFKDTNVIDAPQADDSGKIGGFTSYMVNETKKRMGIASVKDGMADGGWTWVRGGDAWRGSND